MVARSGGRLRGLVRMRSRGERTRKKRVGVLGSVSVGIGSFFFGAILFSFFSSLCAGEVGRLLVARERCMASRLLEFLIDSLVLF